VSSSLTDTLATVAFAPNRETLDAAIALLAERSRDGALDAQRRAAALARFLELPAPGMRPGRNWKYDYDKLRFEGLRWTLGGDELVTILAPANLDPRVTVLPLDAATRRDFAATLDGIDHEIVDWSADKFAALATAFENCGALICVPGGVRLDDPIQVLFRTRPDDEAVFPHIVVVLGKDARATVIERHFETESEPFVCGIVEAHAAEGAELDYAVVQQAGEAARVIFSRGARCERNAQVRWQLAELGGALARTVLDANLAEPGARAETSALFFNTGMQHVDLTSGADHTVGPTESETVVRSAATGRGQGRYVGNIVIRPKAHGSDASLRDDALLLSKHAHIDSIPALEIAANDVKAFHGATVGSLDEDALFYAGSRGIARQAALRLITLGFFEPVVARFPSEALREEVRSALDHKIDDATEIDG
jgi:Fe-S cluster assembly protein SufD